MGAGINVCEGWVGVRDETRVEGWVEAALGREGRGVTGVRGPGQGTHRAGGSTGLPCTLVGPPGSLAGSSSSPACAWVVAGEEDPAYVAPGCEVRHSAHRGRWLGRQDRRFVHGSLSARVGGTGVQRGVRDWVAIGARGVALVETRGPVGAGSGRGGCGSEPASEMSSPDSRLVVWGSIRVVDRAVKCIDWPPRAVVSTGPPGPWLGLLGPPVRAWAVVCVLQV
jgi:hypothetical protein